MVRTDTARNDSDPSRGVFDSTYEFGQSADFERLRITVWDTFTNKKKSAYLGEMVLTKSVLEANPKGANWFPLYRNPMSDGVLVTGEILLDILYEPERAKISVTVARAVDLASQDSNGLSDPFVKLVFGKKKAQTEVAKMTLNPEYNQTFEFKLGRNSPHSMSLSVWDWDRASADDFMGQVKIYFKDLVAGKRSVRWWLLHPRPTIVTGSAMADQADIADGSVVVLAKSSECALPIPPSADSSPVSTSGDVTPPNGAETPSHALSSTPVGSLYLRYEVNRVAVCPPPSYLELHNLLIEEPAATIALLNTLPGSAEMLARELFAFYHHANLSVALLKMLMASTVGRTADPGTLFRSNTLVTKLARNFLKVVGKSYLTTKVLPLIEDLRKSDLAIEVDPNRLEEDEDVDAHWQNLLVVMAKTVAVYFTSVDAVPVSIRRVFTELRTLVRNAWPEDPNVEMTAVGGFFFLRFANPAMITPSMMGLDVNHPTPAQRRASTLVTKTLQNLSNMVLFGRKEPFMEPMNMFIEQQMPYMREFLSELSEEPPSANEPSFPVANPGDVDPSSVRALAQIHSFLERHEEHMETEVKDMVDSGYGEFDADFVARLASAMKSISGIRDQALEELAAGSLEEAREASSSAAMSLSQAMNRLSAGAVFMKYKMSKSAFTKARQKRHVACDLDAGELIVKEVGSRKVQARNRFPLSSLEAVVAGFHTKTFLKYGKEEEEHLCFSIITENRTVDLMCRSEGERDEWVVAYATLIHALDQERAC